MEGLSSRPSPPPPPPSWGGYAMVYTPASVPRRIAAATINGLILIVAIPALFNVVAQLAENAGVLRNDRAFLVVAAAIQLIVVGGVVGYYGLGWRSGGTPGMRFLGLTLVERDSGNLLRTEDALLRMAGGFWSVVLGLAGVIWATIPPERRGWHDRLARTVVVHGATRSWSWQWDGTKWVPDTAGTSPDVPQPTGRRAPSPPFPRSRWTWTDALPIAVLQLPVALVSQLAVVRATRAVGLGRPEASVGSLILDVVGYGAVVLLIWLFLGLRRHASLRDVGVRSLPWRWMAAAIPALVIAYTAELVFGEVGDALLPTSPPNQCRDIQSAYGSSLLLELVGVAVVAPIVEELLFRGVIFGWLRGRMRLSPAVVVSALVFAAAHVLYLQWNLLPPIFAIGCVLAILYNYSRSIWPGVVVHASINTIATLALYFRAVHC